MPEEINEWPDEIYEEAYSDYLAEIGEIPLSNSERRLLHWTNVDEWNEIHGDEMKMPYEDPNEYLDVGGAPVPYPPEWNPEEMGLDEDGARMVEEPDKPFLQDE